MSCKRIFTVALSCLYVAGFLLSCKVLLHEEQPSTDREKRAKEIFLRTHPENETDLPLIYIGGMPRSGTTLMRTMLEAHEDIRCGPETHILPDLLVKLNKWKSDEKRDHRLTEAGVEPIALDIAVGKFMLEIIKYHGPPTLFYCNKDPLLLTDMTYLKKIFPNSKYIYMIRDGRASAHSIVSRRVTIVGVNVNSYRSVLKYWNNITDKIYRQCKEVGKKACLPVQYEQLVLQPIKTTKEIFEFLDIEWCPNVLHHEKHIGNITLSRFEKSTDQVQKPLYLDALTSWFGKIPPSVERDLPKIAPMLTTLGYDPTNPTPTYGEPDDFVLGKVSY